MRREFRLSEVMVTMFHSHGQKNTAKSGIDGCRGNLFDERMETVKMKDGQNAIRESGQRHPQRDAKVSV